MNKIKIENLRVFNFAKNLNTSNCVDLLDSLVIEDIVLKDALNKGAVAYNSDDFEMSYIELCGINLPPVLNKVKQIETATLFIFNYRIKKKLDEEQQKVGEFLLDFSFCALPRLIKYEPNSEDAMQYVSFKRATTPNKKTGFYSEYYVFLIHNEKGSIH